jgi:lipoate-protein ligase A
VTALPAAAARIAGTWRVMDSGRSDGAGNMAWDLALLDRARESGEATLRIYAWERPTLSLGRHERARGRFDAAGLAAAGVGVVRRPTGGRALLHHREVTYSVTAPASGLSLAESYRAINGLLVSALAELGVAARPAPRRSAPKPPGTTSCFSEPNEGELEVDAGKLVGSAQCRDDGAFLQHGSILLADDQSRIADLAVAGGSGAGRVASLGAVLGREVGYAEVRDALCTALDRHCRASGVTSPAVVESDPGMLGAVDRYRIHFSDPAWTWSR